MRPCPAQYDGVWDTFVGFFPCVCSYEAWNNSLDEERSFDEYHKAMVDLTQEEPI